MQSRSRSVCWSISLGVFGALWIALWPQDGAAQVTAFKQAVAEASAEDADIAGFYRGNGYTPIWTGEGDEARDRRAALLRALGQAKAHGLPSSRYDPAALMEQMRAVRSSRDLGLLEAELTKTFLRFARELQTGILVPAQVDRGIKRVVPYRDRASYLQKFLRSEPTQFFRELHPQTVEYTALMSQKLRLERQLSRGGWGPTVPGSKLAPGQSGRSVVALRNRLIAKGYLRPSASALYDDALQQAVKDFQSANGLEADGVAGSSTVRALNRSVLEQLQLITVAMERERWMNRDRGARHILVNLTDFSAQIVDNGKATFETRSVIGKQDPDRRSPEFSDVMEYMVINPTWYVPRSIATKQYLPQLKRNPNALRHLVITDRRGRKVNRSSVNFSRYSAGSFPYGVRQPPGRSNALGLVKFMFPNKYNIYLHDTPAKNLFKREVRAFSHGCIRLADPFDFAYALLSKQEADPKAFFQRTLRTGRETYVNLTEPVPVHIIYRTAFTNAKGQPQFRPDVYGRDARIWAALQRAGVELGDVQG